MIMIIIIHVKIDDDRDHHRSSSFVYDAIITIMTIIIIHLRCDHHPLCTLRSSSSMYDAIIIICVQCGHHHNHPCTMQSFLDLRVFFFVGFFCELFGYPCELLWIFGLIFFWDFSLSNHRIAKSGPNGLLLEQKGRRLHNGRIILTLLSW